MHPYDSIDRKQHSPLVPHCSIRTCIKLFSSKSKTLLAQSNYDYPTPNFQRHLDKPNHLLFHNFQKFSSSQFEFNKIFDQKTSNQFIQQQVDLFEELVKNNHNVCILAVGGPRSGIRQMCYGENGKDGIFFSVVAKLWDKISNLVGFDYDHRLAQEFQSPRLLLRLVVLANDKLYDLLDCKNQVTLKEKAERFILMGCNSYQMSNTYDLLIKLREVYEHRNSMYPESIMIIQGQISIDKPSIGRGNCRYFSLVQWQKHGDKSQSSSINNNHALLALNKCVYELYKYSCRHQNNEEQTKQLWTHFRNSNVTKILKKYLVRQARLLTLGCVCLDENQQSQSYQTLMLCKNISKLNFDNVKQNLRYQDWLNQNQKIKTEPSSAVYLKQNLSHLAEVKNKLKTILQQKKSQQEHKQPSKLISLFKKESSKKIELESIRLKKEEIQIRQRYSNIKNTLPNYSSISDKDTLQQRPNLALPKITNHNYQTQTAVSSNNIQSFELQRLNQLEIKTAKQLQQLHRELSQQKISQGIQQSRSILHAKIKMQQKQMIAYIDQKQKLIRLLRQQAQQIKPNHKYARRRIGKVRTVPVNSHSQPDESPNTKQLQNISDVQSKGSMHSQIKNQNPQKSAQKPDILKYQALRKVNKNNYLFEKRRLELKLKLSKGRAEVNNFYEEAAQKYQQYKPK